MDVIKKKTKREYAIELLESNACMIDSCLSKEELKKVNGSLVQYLENCLKRLQALEQKEGV